MKQKLAKLTEEQDAIWTKLFEIASNSGLSDREADAEAWAGLVEQFPQLEGYEGAEL